jgi:hypothetical protein
MNSGQHANRKKETPLQSFAFAFLALGFLSCYLLFVRRMGVRDLGNYLCSQRQADAAGGIIDPALRQGQFAAAIAGFRVHAAKSHGFLLRS